MAQPQIHDLGNCTDGWQNLHGPTLTRVGRRRWVIGGVVGALVLAGVGAVAVPRLLPDCGQAVTEVTSGQSSSPFLDAQDRAEQPDHDRDTLVATLDAAEAPFGEVLGAVGYHYEQWAQVSAFEQGIGVRTRDNPDFTMLDDQSLKPLWSVQVSTKRSTYDASDRDYVVATMPAKAAPTLVSLDADTGRRRWCQELGGSVVGAEDPFGTQILDDGSVVVLTPGSGTKEHLTRLSGKDGATQWQRTTGADEGDFLGSLGDGMLLAGGSAHETFLDTQALADRPASRALVAFSASSGKQRWTWDTPAGSGAHVVGTDPGTGIAVVEEWTGGVGRLVALDRDGKEIWTVGSPGAGFFDSTLRAGRVLVRSGNRWAAYDARDGHRLWQRLMPTKPQFLPYGFELGSIPLLDEDHALVGGTTALHVLDLNTGRLSSTALPTDGINTTYWPYQTAVSAGLIAVATNTGAVVMRRE